MTNTKTTTCDQYLSHPPEDVWRALTTPELIARWWAPGDVAPTVGHRFSLDMDKWGTQPCEVVAVEPGRLISYVFAEGTLDTTITWQVVPEGTGTRLFLEHKGFDLDSPMGRQAYEGMGAGWPNVLRRIDGSLEGVDLATSCPENGADESSDPRSASSRPNCLPQKAAGIGTSRDHVVRQSWG